LIDRFDTLDEENADGYVAYVENFLDNTSGVLDGGPTIPEESPVAYANINSETLYADQPNALRESATCIGDGFFGFSADVPDGFSLKIVLTVTDGYVSWHVRGGETGWDEVGNDVHLEPESQEPPDGSSNNVGATQTFVTDLASDSHVDEIMFSGLGTVEMAFYANGLSGAYMTKTITVVACERTANVEVEAENPEDPPTNTEYSVCDFADSEATCDEPLERNETPEL
ncbi:MAG: hypothetical protein KC561_20915, partial [Myxococcales bacterium]|nr:hypothetical protein [Myxococcales bacterium]